MPAELVINVRPYETRVGLVENGHLVEFHVEWNKDQVQAGNIYQGRVARILPGMEAAFIDIGLVKAAFLHAGDLRSSEVKSEPPAPAKEPPRIEDLLFVGQQLLVQVAKEPLGSKGARITTRISLPGRLLVLTPHSDHVGVSRRITNEAERERLREVLNRLKADGAGLIARTVAEGSSEEKLSGELKFLTRLWQAILRQAQASPCPSLIHQDLTVSVRAVRDLFTQEVDRLIIDDEIEHRRVLDFIEAFSPGLIGAVELYRAEEPIFDAFGLEVKLTRALNRKVWLKSGGSIVIESTEAGHTIDVNTGSYVGSRNLEETILKTNLEAVKEIAWQLRLRNIGGLVVIDFIDMERPTNRQRVAQALKDALRSDRSRTHILPMSELGLIEMTRQRTKEEVGHLLSEPCPYCQGEGRLASPHSLAHDILRAVEREAVEMGSDKIIVRAHPEVAAVLLEEDREAVESLEQSLEIQLQIEADDSLHLETYEVQS
ncbi:MAG: Rne/Rng family ribonuclease [Deltaproteobacteria bacterium]|nr:Rne/Rng family ribonuclease [Deltaproteobacteria bacterium]